MARKKLGLLEKYKIGVILIIVGLAIWCQLHKDIKGEWNPIILPEQMVTIITMVITNLFITVFEIAPSKALQHTKGLVLIAFMAMIAVSIGLQIPIATYWWAIIGGIIGFVFKGETS